MAGGEKTGKKKKAINTVTSRVKNHELVLQKQMHIAKKASKLFLKKGYHRTSMRDISDATGMAVGNLYNYIKQKEDVLCLVFDVFHRSLREYLEKQDVYHIEDPQEQLRAYICCLLANADNFRDEIIFMYSESWLLPKAFKEIFMQKELNNILDLEKIIKKCAANGTRIEHSFYTASMIIYQLSIEPLRGWTFRDRHSIAEIHRITADYILKTVTNAETTVPC
jgi:AcrR family transcriptional regulator